MKIEVHVDKKCMCPDVFPSHLTNNSMKIDYNNAVLIKHLQN